MRKLTLWTRQEELPATPRSFADVVAVTRSGTLRAAHDGGVHDGGVTDERAEVSERDLTIAPGNGTAPAVLFVPDELSRRATINARRVGGGMHLLAHGDCVQLDGATFWLSTDSGAEETTFDPVRHGEDMFCFRTKARLNKGDAIVICPGTARVPCGMIYKASAWALGTRCHNCRHDPKAPRWTPPAPRERTSLETLFALLEE